MDMLPDVAGPLGLILLALVDSTSMGTLVIPLILLVTADGGARRAAGRTLLYLAIIGLFYLALGVGLLAGLLPLLERYGHLLSSAPVTVGLLVAGIGLIVWSYRTDPATIRKRGGDPEKSAARWSDRARSAAGRPGTLVLLALGAGIVEAASMIPYLAAMGIIADMGVGIGGGALVLVGYCAVMILPGVVLCGLRILAGRRADAALDRFHAWSIRSAASAFSWAVGIIGVLLVLNTAGPVIAIAQGVA
ncbi:GAP family protein [Brachybacterium sp. DNPG3]